MDKGVEGLSWIVRRAQGMVERGGDRFDRTPSRFVLLRQFARRKNLEQYAGQDQRREKTGA